MKIVYGMTTIAEQDTITFADQVSKEINEDILFLMICQSHLFSNPWYIKLNLQRDRNGASSLVNTNAAMNM